MSDRKPQNSKWQTQRKHTRFKSEANQIVRMEWGARVGKNDFNPQFVGLVLEEAFGGCALAMNAQKKVQMGDRVRVQVGSFNPMFGEIVWKSEIDESLMKIGIKFLE